MNYKHHPGEEYNKWLTYGIKNEYEDLKILFYEKHNSFVINNYDIIIISFIIIFIFFYLVIMFCKFIFCPFCCCCCHCSYPQKNDIKKDTKESNIKKNYSKIKKKKD